MAKHFYTSKSKDPKHARLFELERKLSENFFNNDDYLENKEKYQHIIDEYEQLKRELRDDPFNFTDEELED